MAMLEQVELVGGEKVYAHASFQCAREYGHCPIHNPSDHHMASWRQHWRDDRGIMERICEHGVGHPDPDDYLCASDPDQSAHGCDGCCEKNRDTRDMITAQALRAIVGAVEPEEPEEPEARPHLAREVGVMKYVMPYPGEYTHFLEWGRQFAKDRHVDLTVYPTIGVTVSTVFLGMNHNYGDEGEPLWYETMVFDREGDSIWMDRYSTYQEAKFGHYMCCLYRKWETGK